MLTALIRGCLGQVAFIIFSLVLLAVYIKYTGPAM